MSHVFYIVDVFAEEKYAGNQLAVVRGGADLSDIVLQKIALEMNYSETTFIPSDKEIDGGHGVRIFTPGGEVPFAGHPTLGTAYVIRHQILAEPVDHINLDMKAGRIPVTFGEVLWMRQLPPTFGKTLDPSPFAGALDLEPGDLDDRFPVQEVSTGLPAFIIPLKTLDALRRCKVDRERYVELAGRGKNLYVFCPEPHENGLGDLSARMFADDLGVPEDPATGSAAGCLAGYLVEHDYFGTKSVDVRVEQGYEIRRPSLLYLRSERNGDRDERPRRRQSADGGEGRAGVSYGTKPSRSVKHASTIRVGSRRWCRLPGTTPTVRRSPKTCEGSSSAKPTRRSHSGAGWRPTSSSSRRRARRSYGFADFRTLSDTEVELSAIYVLPEAQRRGNGARLLETGIARLPTRYASSASGRAGQRPRPTFL